MFKRSELSPEGTSDVSPQRKLWVSREGTSDVSQQRKPWASPEGTSDNSPQRKLWVGGGVSVSPVHGAKDPFP